MTKNVSVIGLGKLGSPMAACFASKGLRVVGVDADPRKVDAINQGKEPVFEPRLQEFLDQSKGRLSAVDSIQEAVMASDVTFIVVATPSEPGGGFSLRYALPACEAIGRALRAKQGFHLVVLTSTVMPGSTGSAVRAALEQASAKSVGSDFGLCYNPEFIALGSVIRDFLNPDLLLIGESDSRSGDILEAVYKQVCENTPVVARMNFVNAEVTKLAINTYLTTKISFANMVARLCEKLPEADVDVVTAALGQDTRIGTKYLKGAVSYGGPCFPRDNLALGALARQVGAPDDLAKATDLFNRSQVSWLADLAQSCSTKGAVVGILGLTYKPHTDVVEEAAGLNLALELAKRGVSVVASDPAGQRNSAAVLDGKVRFATSSRECIREADVIVVATPWPEFRNIPHEEWARHSEPRTVIDCWRALKHLDNHEGLRYVCLGTGGLPTEFQPSAGSRLARQSTTTSTLTIFAAPKPFHGSTGLIQRNAIANWTRLSPRPEIILFGDEEGTAEIAQELGLRQVPEVECNEFGTPLLNALFEKAQALASHGTLCYINADILLLDGFLKAVEQVAAWRESFLMVGRRADVDLDQAEACVSADEEARMLVQILREKAPMPPGAIDYFVFSRGVFGAIPPFTLGRTVWDNWLLWKAHSSRAAVVDASTVIIAAHPRHGYSHHPQGRQGIYGGEEAIRNQRLAGRHLRT
ncbi:MAG: nucleotide sugar dehydrogenase, partial [Acidobacteriia bacterium]|nr:nucleotide sugar dehydrogenase [Terriglobia bacterium]